MRPLTFTAFVGFALMMASTWCPMLHPLIFHSWDVYDLNKPYGMTMLLVFVVGILGTVLNQHKITKMAALISLALVVLLYIAAVLKVHAAFSFIPFKGIDDYLTSKITFKWGWYLLFAGQLLALAGVVSNKPKKIL